jgi:hypothetical protein
MTQAVQNRDAGVVPEAGTSRALPRRRFIDDMPDKGLFGFVAIAGFAPFT